VRDALVYGPQAIQPPDPGWPKEWAPAASSEKQARELLDGTIHHLYGEDVVGYLIYTADGFMSAEIMDPDRQQSDPDFPLEPAGAQTLPDPDRARAYGTYLSYRLTWERAAPAPAGRS
jgi:hypothetical protein